MDTTGLEDPFDQIIADLADLQPEEAPPLPQPIPWDMHRTAFESREEWIAAVNAQAQVDWEEKVAARSTEWAYVLNGHEIEALTASRKGPCQTTHQAIRLLEDYLLPRLNRDRYYHLLPYGRLEDRFGWDRRTSNRVLKYMRDRAMLYMIVRPSSHLHRAAIYQVAPLVYKENGK